MWTRAPSPQKQDPAGAPSPPTTMTLQVGPVSSSHTEGVRATKTSSAPSETVCGDAAHRVSVCVWCCTVASVPGSPHNQGKELDLVTFTRKAVDFRCLNLAVATRLQSKTTSTCDCFVAIYLCCCANTRIVDSEMNVQGQSIPQRFGSQGELSGFCL